mgnify:CR=1 FL=1
MIWRALLFVLVLVGPAQAEVNIKEVTSPGGITAWLVEEPSIPFVALEIRFQGGASLDEAGKRGVTNLMMGLLEEGADDLDARGFAEAREALAASYSFDTTDDTVSISAEFLTENRDASVALLRSAILNPRFDEDAIARVKGQVAASIRSDLSDPDRIAAETYSEMVFGTHPYGSTVDGTLESLEGITRDDLAAARLAALAKARMFIGAVGDITEAELGPLLDTLLGELPETGAPMPDTVSYDLAGGTTVVSFEGPQSVAFFGQEGIAFEDPDYFPAFLLMEILGGAGLQSRLSNEVREERGLTYSIGSFLVPKDHADLILGTVRSSNDRSAEAIEIVRQEWARIAEDGVTAEELQRTKTYLTGAYPLRFDGNARIAGIMASMQHTGLGLDYIPTRNDRVEAVTLEDVNRVAGELLRADDLHFVVVGEPEGLTSTN